MKNISLAIICFVLIAAGITAIIGNKAIAKAEKAECAEWKKSALEIKGYYLVAWQDDQCRSYGISINAPVLQTKHEYPATK